MSEAIQVWAFCEAPVELRALSGHGGDEDWLALVPAEYDQDYIPWLDSSSFGCAGVEEHRLPDGRRVFIGAHA